MIENFLQGLVTVTEIREGLQFVAVFENSNLVVAANDIKEFAAGAGYLIREQFVYLGIPSAKLHQQCRGDWRMLDFHVYNLLSHSVFKYRETFPADVWQEISLRVFDLRIDGHRPRTRRKLDLRSLR